LNNAQIILISNFYAYIERINNGELKAFKYAVFQAKPKFGEFMCFE